MNDFSVPLKNLENAIVGHEEEDLTCPSRLLDLVLALFRLHSFSVFATGLCHFLGVKQKRKKVAWPTWNFVLQSHHTRTQKKNFSYQVLFHSTSPIQNPIWSTSCHRCLPPPWWTLQSKRWSRSKMPMSTVNFPGGWRKFFKVQSIFGILDMECH